MDFLDSLLSSVEAPKRRTDPQAVKERERQAAIKELEDKEKKRRTEFTNQTWEQLKALMQNPRKRSLHFAPASATFRGIIHDAAQEYKLASHGFGVDEVNRAVTVFKEDAAPTAEQLQLMDRQLPYEECMKDLRTKEKEAKARAKAADRRAEQNKAISATAAESPAVPSRYHQRMEKLVKKADAAAVSASSFGMVSKEMKRDTRSVEEALRDIKANKRRRLDDSGAAAED